MHYAMTDRLIGQRQRRFSRDGSPAKCCCEMSASASRRNDTDRSLARSAWASIPQKNRPRRVRYDRAR